MCKINVKKSLLEVVKNYNLEILKNRPNEL